MNTELFYPAPEGLPVAIRPPRGSIVTLQTLQRYDWKGEGKARNGELMHAGALWLHGESIPCAILCWHALMHRSEGDYNNSKYWYRRVGRHPIFPDLFAAVRQLETSFEPTRGSLLQTEDWDPFRFVDAIEDAARHPTQKPGLLQAVVREEYKLLMNYCMTRL